MAQCVKHWPCKHEAQFEHPDPTKKARWLCSHQEMGSEDMRILRSFQISLPSVQQQETQTSLKVEPASKIVQWEPYAPTIHTTLHSHTDVYTQHAIHAFAHTSIHAYTDFLTVIIFLIFEIIIWLQNFSLLFSSSKYFCICLPSLLQIHNLFHEKESMPNAA